MLPQARLHCEDHHEQIIKILCLALLATCAAAYAEQRALPDEKTAGKIEQVVAFTGSMPTGVTVAEDEKN